MDKRICEIWNETSWIETSFSNIKIDDRFRLFDIISDVKIPVKTDIGFTEFISLENTSLLKPDFENLGVKVDPVHSLKESNGNIIRRT